MISVAISPGKRTIYIAIIRHIFYGHANRKISEEQGFWVYLAPWLHNQSAEGVHGANGKELDLLLKRHAQAKFEETHSRDEFIRLIGKNYL